MGGAAAGVCIETAAAEFIENRLLYLIVALRSKLENPSPALQAGANNL
jgi:hypothetical protein